MKIKFFLCLLLPFLLSACSNQPKHPQASLAGNYSDLPENDRSVLQYADSIDASIDQMDKQTSLVFQMDDHSLYAEKFSWQGVPNLYTEHIIDEGITHKTTSFYLKKDTLILIKEILKRPKTQKDIFEERRTYFRNNIPFKQENRIAGSSEALKNIPFKDLNVSNTTTHSREKIDMLNDALSGKNKFDMVFDECIATPEGQYILLKSKIQTGYHASLKINESDSYTDSLSKYPGTFKDSKLNIAHEIRNNEAIYVPVAARVTSASGLNR